MTLPSFIQVKPEVAEMDKRRQRIARERHLRGARQSPAEIKFARAISAEKAIRANLETLDRETQPEAWVTTKLQLAEALADQGKFSEAGRLVKDLDPKQYEWYRSLQDALVADDDKVCNCEGAKIHVTRSGARGPVSEEVEIPPMFVAGHVFSTRHGRIMPIMKCASCDFMNITRQRPGVEIEQIEKTLRDENK